MLNRFSKEQMTQILLSMKSYYDNINESDFEVSEDYENKLFIVEGLMKRFSYSMEENAELFLQSMNYSDEILGDDTFSTHIRNALGDETWTEYTT